MEMILAGFHVRVPLTFKESKKTAANPFTSGLLRKAILLHVGNSPFNINQWEGNSFIIVGIF